MADYLVTLSFRYGSALAFVNEFEGNMEDVALRVSQMLDGCEWLRVKCKQNPSGVSVVRSEDVTHVGVTSSNSEQAASVRKELKMPVADVSSERERRNGTSRRIS